MLGQVGEDGDGSEEDLGGGGEQRDRETEKDELMRGRNAAMQRVQCVYRQSEAMYRRSRRAGQASLHQESTGRENQLEVSLKWSGNDVVWGALHTSCGRAFQKGLGHRVAWGWASSGTWVGWGRIVCVENLKTLLPSGGERAKTTMENYSDTEMTGSLFSLYA